MSSGSLDTPISTLLVDDSFASANDEFVAQVRAISSGPYLAALADRWKKDPRPWAREQIFQYLALPLDRPGHHPLVKRLFKQAEANRDHELMGAFLVAFDRLVRRQRRLSTRYDYQARQVWQVEELRRPKDQILPPAKPREVTNPRTGQRITIPVRNFVPKNGRLFSNATRNYLRRRVCRYFRRLGLQKPDEYMALFAGALARYRDDDFARGENILDNWSLMQLAFRRSPALRFTRATVELAEGRSLATMLAAPRFESLWQQPAAAELLLKLLISANSRLVRVWAIELLRRHHRASLGALPVEQFLRLLNHDDQEVQQFAAGLLETLDGIDSWPISTWLALLDTRNVSALATICAAMARRVRPERLTLNQTVALASARTTPVARLGFSCLLNGSFFNRGEAPSALQLAALATLANAQCEAVGQELAQFALSVLGLEAVYRIEQVSPFFDSLNPQIRRGAWEWLVPGARGWSDAALWSRLLETPYDDVRLKLVEELGKRSHGSSAPAALARQDLAPIWTTVLLGVHRGGRSKLKALRQISKAIAEQPQRAEQLIPVLAVAIRSVRPPEVRAGLAAILSAVSRRPELETLLAHSIPELILTPSQVMS